MFAFSPLVASILYKLGLSIVVRWKQVNVEANDGLEKNEEKENVLSDLYQIWNHIWTWTKSDFKDQMNLQPYSHHLEKYSSINLYFSCRACGIETAYRLPINTLEAHLYDISSRSECCCIVQKSNLVSAIWWLQHLFVPVFPWLSSTNSSMNVARRSAVYSACQLSLHVLVNIGILSNSNILCSDLSVCRPGFALGILVFLNTHCSLLPDSCAAMAQRRCFERTKPLPLLPPLFFGSLATEANSWAQTFPPDLWTMNCISYSTGL